MNGSARLAQLVAAVRQLEGLTEQIGAVALPAGTCDRAPGVVAAVCSALGVPLRFDAATAGAARDFAAEALAAELRRAQAHPDLAGVDPEEAAEEAVRLRMEEDLRHVRRALRRPDGTDLAYLDAGLAGAGCIVFSPACAMSYRLCVPWIDALSDRYRCLVPQTRGTSGPIGVAEDFDRRGWSVEHQADDLVALIEEAADAPVHVLSLCGGVVPALLAASRRPDLIDSLSLWHGDLELGPEAAKTDHQTNLRAMLDLAGESRSSAAWLRERLISGPMHGVPDGVGPLVVRPYATPELFYRYAKLTGATMHWDSRATAAGVWQPCLVVTSRDDSTAHPDGSRRLAEILPDARLVVADHGTHLDAFDASPAHVQCLQSFLPALRDRRPAPART